MRRLGQRLALAAALVLAGGWDAPTRPDPDVEEGNRAFAAGDYQAALRAYQRAFSGDGDRARLHFDTGAALYELASAAEEGPREALLERAETAFRRAAASTEPAIAAAAYFNLGNVLYQRERFEGAIGAYRRALRLDPDHDDARHNLELALRRQDEPPAAPSSPGANGGAPSAPPEGGGAGAAAAESDRNEGATGTGEGEGQGEGEAGAEAPEGAGGRGEQPGRGAGERRETGAEPPEGSPEPSPPRERPPGAEGRGERAPSSGAESDVERKLRELERRSRELRRRQLRRGSRDLDPSRLQPRKDW